jgi:hypothetical protein
MMRQATTHRVFLKQVWERIPEEFVEYDTGVVDQHLNRLDLDVEDHRILLGAREPWREIKFFREALGFSSIDNDLHLESRLPRWQGDIRITHDACAPIDQPLDIAGYAALAFYSTDVEADRDKAIAAGGRTPTEPFTVNLDREMKIIMLRSPEGTIIELIQVLK